MDKIVPSSWISEIFLCYYTLCKFAFLMPFWKCNISDENFFQFWTSVNVLHFTFQTGEKNNHSEVSMLQEIKAVTKKQPSFWYTLVP